MVVLAFNTQRANRARSSFASASGYCQVISFPEPEPQGLPFPNPFTLWLAVLRLWAA
jgi:hypothetical protein